MSMMMPMHVQDCPHDGIAYATLHAINGLKRGITAAVHAVEDKHIAECLKGDMRPA
jgi:hypothetical protein